MNITAPQTHVEYLTGTALVLTCDIEVHNAVDTGITISVVWQQDEIEISNTTSVSITQPTLIYTNQYVALLNFSILSSSADGGTYTCTATANPVGAESYVTSASGMAIQSFSVTGMHYYYMLVCSCLFTLSHSTNYIYVHGVPSHSLSR